MKARKLPERIFMLLEEQYKRPTRKDTKPFNPLKLPEGARHDFIVSMAGYFRHRGFNDDQTQALLEKVNEQACYPTLSDNEVEGIAMGSADYDSLYKAKTKCLADHEEQEPEFLIDPYFQKRVANIMEGDPGVGKSSLIADLTASITTGKKFFDIKPSCVGKVLFFAFEDDPYTVFKARSRLQEADDKKIDYLDEPLNLDEAGFNYLHQALSSERYELVIIDTFTSVTAGKDLNKGNEMASLLRDLNHLARIYETTIIIVRHLRKAGSDNAVYAGQGSISIIGGVRSSVMVKRCPDNPNERFFAHNKCNGFEYGQTLIFTIESVEGERTGKLFWKEKNPLTAEEIVAISNKNHTEADKAEEFLREYLFAGPVKSSLVIKEAKRRGIAIRTLNRIKGELNVQSSGGPGSKWSLPEEDD